MPIASHSLPVSSSSHLSWDGIQPQWHLKYSRLYCYSWRWNRKLHQTEVTNSHCSVLPSNKRGVYYEHWLHPSQRGFVFTPKCHYSYRQKGHKESGQKEERVIVVVSTFRISRFLSVSWELLGKEKAEPASSWTLEIGQVACSWS